MTSFRIKSLGTSFHWAGALLLGVFATGLVEVVRKGEPAVSYRSVVIDAETRQPIADAKVTAGHTVVLSDPTGSFQIDTAEKLVRLRAAGYERRDMRVADLADASSVLMLKPFHPKALYLSFYGIGSKALRDGALRLLERTELNALVIDVKGDQGRIPFESRVPLAAQIGAQRSRTIPDISALMRSLHDRGIYTIARIVVFKDNVLAQARPDLAVTRGGSLWRDREHLAWTDPFRHEVWEYNIDIAEEAAARGFDEIQFDYVRFPDASNLQFAKAATAANRIGAIGDFLAAARERLAPYNVFLAADIFGYVCWNLDDTGIGQKLERLAPLLDVISPMLYPSSFQFGIPGYHNPVAHPAEIVYLSLVQASRHTNLPAARFRPWLQAFKDYAFDRRAFNGDEIRLQIDAAEKFGSNGWMLWNAHNVYSAEGLHEE